MNPDICIINMHFPYLCTIKVVSWAGYKSVTKIITNILEDFILYCHKQ